MTNGAFVLDKQNGVRTAKANEGKLRRRKTQRVSCLLAIYRYQQQTTHMRRAHAASSGSNSGEQARTTQKARQRCCWEQHLIAKRTPDDACSSRSPSAVARARVKFSTTQSVPAAVCSFEASFQSVRNQRARRISSISQPSQRGRQEQKQPKQRSQSQRNQSQRCARPLADQRGTARRHPREQPTAITKRGDTRGKQRVREARSDNTRRGFSTRTELEGKALAERKSARTNLAVLLALFLVDFVAVIERLDPVLSTGQQQIRRD